MWIKGEQQEIVLLAFQIYDDPDETVLDDETYDLFMDAHQYLSKKGEALYGFQGAT